MNDCIDTEKNTPETEESVSTAIQSLNFSNIQDVLFLLLNKYSAERQQREKLEIKLIDVTQTIEELRLKPSSNSNEMSIKLAEIVRQQAERMRTMELTVANLCYNLTGEESDLHDHESHNAMEALLHETIATPEVGHHRNTMVIKDNRKITTTREPDKDESLPNTTKKSQTEKKRATESVSATVNKVGKEKEEEDEEETAQKEQETKQAKRTGNKAATSPPAATGARATGAPATATATTGATATGARATGAPANAATATVATATVATATGATTTGATTTAAAATTTTPTKLKSSTAAAIDTDSAAPGGRGKSWMSLKSQVKRMDPKKVKEMRQMFQLFDTDRSGSIEEEEIKALIKALGVDMDDNEISQLLKDNDTDGDCCLSEEEFIVLLTKTPVLTKQMNIGNKKIEHPSKSLGQRVKTLEQFKHTAGAVFKRTEHMIETVSKNLEAFKEQKEAIQVLQKESRATKRDLETMKDMILSVEQKINDIPKTPEKLEIPSNEHKADRSEMLTMFEEMEKKHVSTTTSLSKLARNVEEKSTKQIEAVELVQNDLVGWKEIMQEALKETREELEIKKADKIEMSTIATRVSTKAEQTFVESTAKDLLAQVHRVFNEIEKDREERRLKEEEEKNKKKQAMSADEARDMEKRMNKLLSGSMTNINYDIERHEKMILLKAEGSKVSELIHRVNDMNPVSEKIIERVQRQMNNKASRNDLVKIASVANKLSSTVQVLHEAHLGEDGLSSATSKCLTCNRAVVSLSRRSPPIHPVPQSPLMPLRLHSGGGNGGGGGGGVGGGTTTMRSRPSTASPASSQMRRWGGSVPGLHSGVRVPYEMLHNTKGMLHKKRPSSSHASVSCGALLRDEHHSQQSPIHGGLTLVRAESTNGSYVQSCDGRMFKGEDAAVQAARMAESRVRNKEHLRQKMKRESSWQMHQVK